MLGQEEYYLVIKNNENPDIFHKIDGTEDHYTK